jgi:hypothetical protein
MPWRWQGAAPAPISAVPEEVAKEHRRTTLSGNGAPGFAENSEGNGVPYVRNATNAQRRGYEAARLNIEEALRTAEGLNAPERIGFVTGVFSFLAQHDSPANGLKHYQQLPDHEKPIALRALVAEWI